MQARHDRERYDRQHDDTTHTTGGDGLEGTYTGGSNFGEDGRVGRHSESILGSGSDVEVASTDINSGDAVISRTSEYVHAVMSSSSHPPRESQGTSSSLYSSSNSHVNARREESFNRSLADFTTDDIHVAGGGTYNTGVNEKTTRKRASSVDRHSSHPSDRVSESLLGPTGDIYPLFFVIRSHTNTYYGLTLILT